MAIEAQMYPLGGGSHDNWLVDNGCGGGGSGGFSQFCFNVQQKHQLQQQQQQLQAQQQINQNHFLENSFLVPSLENNNISSNNIMSFFSPTMEAQAAKHKQEIDQYIRLQNERLRIVLHEQKKQQLAMLMKKIEAKTQVVLKQKDDEITHANMRRMELEDFLRKLEAENLAWQRVAQENEAMVVSLNNTLEQFRERATCCLMNGGDDAESCCDNNTEAEAEAEAESDCVERVIKMKICKSCNYRSSCVLFLPCRHLCSCKACEVHLDCCPVCRTPKKASIEALIF